MVSEDQVTVKAEGQAEVTWLPEWGEIAWFGGLPWLRITLVSGERRREALTTERVLDDRAERRAVIVHIAAWVDDVPDVPATAAYVWGDITLEDGSQVEGLAMLVLDIEGKVRHIEPVVLEVSG